MQANVFCSIHSEQSVAFRRRLLCSFSSLLASRFSLLTSRFSLLTSHFSLLTSVLRLFSSSSSQESYVVRSEIDQKVELISGKGEFPFLDWPA